MRADVSGPARCASSRARACSRARPRPASATACRSRSCAARARARPAARGAAPHSTDTFAIATTPPAMRPRAPRLPVAARGDHEHAGRQVAARQVAADLPVRVLQAARSGAGRPRRAGPAGRRGGCGVRGTRATSHGSGSRRGLSRRDAPAAAGLRARHAPGVGTGASCRARGRRATLTVAWSPDVCTSSAGTAPPRARAAGPAGGRRSRALRAGRRRGERRGPPRSSARRARAAARRRRPRRRAAAAGGGLLGRRRRRGRAAGAAPAPAAARHGEGQPARRGRRVPIPARVSPAPGSANPRSGTASPGQRGASRPASQRSTLAPTSANGPSWRRPPGRRTRRAAGRARACGRCRRGRVAAVVGGEHEEVALAGPAARATPPTAASIACSARGSPATSWRWP